MLLHLLNSLLLWRLLLRLAVPGAWVVAAVFAVHPLHVESVAWIFERKDVLSGLFYLAAVLVWLRFLEQPRPWRYGLALLLFAAGLLSKSIVVTLPVALLMVQWLKEGCITVAGSAAGGALLPGGARHHGSRSLFLRFKARFPGLLLARADAHRVAGLVVLRGQAGLANRSGHYLSEVGHQPGGSLGMALPGRGGGTGGNAVVPAPQDWARSAGRSLVLCGDAVPVLGFVNHGYMQYSFVADRFQYLAGIGVMAVVVALGVQGSGRLPGRLKSGAAGLVVVVLALLGTMTWRQAKIYRDDITFFSHIVSLNPKARSARYNLSIHLARAGPSGGSPGRRPACRGKSPGTSPKTWPSSAPL